MYNVLVLNKNGKCVVNLSDLTTLKYSGRLGAIHYANGQNGVLPLINDFNANVELKLPKIQHIEGGVDAMELTLDAPNLLVCQSFSYMNSLTKFKGDLPNLIDGGYMFSAHRKLTDFIGTLPKLIRGTYIFSQCNLNPQSVANILFSLRDINELKAEKEMLDSKGTYPDETGWQQDGKYWITSPATWSHGDASSNYQSIFFKKHIKYEEIGKLAIGINVSSSVVDGKDTATQLLEFSNEVGFDTWADLKQAFVDKGWNVTFQYGGKYNSTIPYDLRNEEREIPLPIYATLIECENKEMAEYCNEDGTKYYNIEWGHDVTHPEKFQQFDSIEDAAASYGVFRKDFLEENS